MHLFQHLPKRMMQEGKLLHREVVVMDGNRYYVEQVQFPDFHKSIHGFYVNMDHILEGKTIVAQRSDYNDFATLQHSWKTTHSRCFVRLRG